MHAEFDRQVTTLLDAGYPKLAGMTEPAFLELVNPIAERLPTGGAAIPFVLVVTRAVIDPEDAMAATSDGFVDTHPVSVADFVPIDGLVVPDAAVYLVCDVETGHDSLDVTPDDALVSITARGRSPLTIEEGVALLTHHPDILRTHNAYSLLGSRSGDRRVTAIWNSKGRSRLGWCWAGNPHTWLGSASCAARAR